MLAIISNLLAEKIPKRKLLIVLSAVALVAAAWMGAAIGISRSRYTVTGKVDPATGYRIEYTVSSRFRKSPDKDSMAQASHELEAWAYDPLPSSGTAKWIDAHIFGRSPSPTDHRANEHSVRQATIGDKPPPGTSVNSQGFVELNGVTRIGTTVFNQHLLVCGCPATWCSIDIQVGTNKGKKLMQRFFCLFIHPRSRPIIYGFVGMAGDRANAAEVQREMVAIRDSIRINKR